MLKTNGHILQRFLLYVLLICGLMTGQSVMVQAKSPLKHKGHSFERLFDHEQILIAHIDNDLVEQEEVSHADAFFRVKTVPRKRRYYLNDSRTHSSSYTSRLLQLQHNMEFYIPLQENKTGVYQQQRAFLPAYYSFLSRYTPF